MRSERDSWSWRGGKGGNTGEMVKGLRVERVRIIQFCPDDYPSSGVNTFATELNAALIEAGVDSRIVRNVSGLTAADVVHIHGLWLKSMHQASVWARKRNIPVVWSTHGMTAPWSMRHKRWKKILAWWLYQRRDLKRAAVIHSTSEQEREWNAKLLVGSRVTQVPLGTHLPLHSPPTFSSLLSPPHPFTPSPLHPFAHSLLFVGRLYPVKAIDRIITAFQMVPHEGWTLRIVGPDQSGYMSELEKIAGADVVFVGPKYGDDLATEYANCECAILASHTENFGATIVDAMAHAKPVITGTKTPWKIVAERRCGWWVDNDVETLADAIREMMALSDEARAEMGARGRKLVEEKYTWSAVAKEMMRGYEGVWRREKRK